MSTILLIEDDLIVRENTKEMLELYGLKTFTAANGSKGIDLALIMIPDLIICDVMMPETDGYGVLKTLAGNKKTDQIPFIFLSAKTEHKDIRKGMDMGADDYLTKPYEEIELINAVESRLAKAAILKQRNGNDQKPEEQVGLRNLDELKKYFNDTGNILTVNSGAVIYKEGDAANKIYFVLKGIVKTYELEENGKELTTSLCKTDDFFGFTSLIQNLNRQDNAKSLEETKLAAISKEAFKMLLENNQELTLELLNLFSSDLSDVKTQLLQMAYGSVKKKTARAILQFDEILRKNNDQTITISRFDLANVAGIAKESLIRALSDFRKLGLVEITDKNIKILDLKGLKKMT